MGHLNVAVNDLEDAAGNKNDVVRDNLSIYVTSPSSQSRLCLGSHHEWPCLRTTGKQNSPW